MATKDPTPQEVESANDVIERHRAAIARDRAARLKPLADIVATDAFKDMVRAIADVAPTVTDLPDVYPHLIALGQVAHRVGQVVTPADA